MLALDNTTQRKLRQILFATDFKPASDRAFRYARALAKQFSSAVTVNHVVDLSVATTSEMALLGLPLAELRQSALTRLECAVAGLEADGIPAESELLESFNPGSAIVDLSAQLDADLIVLGTNGRHGLEKWILGSCAETVVHTAKCPVLTVGPRAKLPETDTFAPRTLLLATDLEQESAEKAAAAIAFAKETIDTIYLAQVIDLPWLDPAAVESMQHVTETALHKHLPSASLEWCNPHCRADCGKRIQCIPARARACRADLIVLGAHRTSSWFAHLSSGAASHIVAEAEVPVFSVSTGEV